MADTMKTYEELLMEVYVAYEGVPYLTRKGKDVPTTKYTNHLISRRHACVDLLDGDYPEATQEMLDAVRFISIFM